MFPLASHECTLIKFIFLIMILVDFVSAHEHDFLYLFYSYIYDGGSNLYKSLTRFFLISLWISHFLFIIKKYFSMFNTDFWIWVFKKNLIMIIDEACYFFFVGSYRYVSSPLFFPLSVLTCLVFEKKIQNEWKKLGNPVLHFASAFSKI